MPVGGSQLRLFIRQPFTETSEREAAIVQGVLDVLHQLDGAPYQFQFLTGHQAQSSETFRLEFERETGQEFTPINFRKNRLERLDCADAMVVIRTGLSESTAFELAYNIFGGPSAPIFFAIWDQAPIKTTLLRGLNEIVTARYVTFSNPKELMGPLRDFFRMCAKGKGVPTRNACPSRAALRGNGRKTSGRANIMTAAPPRLPARKVTMAIDE